MTITTQEDRLQTVLKLASGIAKPFEGLHKLVNNIVYAYWDPVGYPTIGYGHLLSKVKMELLDKYPTMTFLTAEEQLQKDMIHSAARAVKLSPNLSDPENVIRWSAITDFVFNCGDGNYSISTLRKKINEEDWDAAEAEILKWDKAGGRKLPGLTKRRMAEGKLLLLDS